MGFDFFKTYIGNLCETFFKSTPVVRWHAHPYEPVTKDRHVGHIRGPHGRWFDLADTKNPSTNERTGEMKVAHGCDDIIFAADAMSEFPKLLRVIQVQNSHIRALLKEESKRDFQRSEDIGNIIEDEIKEVLKSNDSRAIRQAVYDSYKEEGYAFPDKDAERVSL